MEANMQILEGAQYRLRVKLTNEAGAQLPPELFRVYAGAFCPGYAPAHFHAERTAAEWVLTMPGLKPGRVPWNWQVIAAEYATGVEWLLAAGEVTVTPRHATGSGYVDPGELKITATLDKTTLQMTVQVGESTSACSLAVVDARNSAKAADTSAKAAANSAEHATEQAQAAETARKQADGSATNAASSADDAHEQATAAEVSATDAANSASAAAGEVIKAAAEVEKAAAEVDKAKQERETAAELADAAAQSAQGALANKQGAEQAARDAQTAKNGAEQAAANADASKSAAQTAEGNAKASATAAAGDKAAAEQAKMDAQASETAAAQSAAAAQSSASILADEVVSLPVDYLRFSEVTNLGELATLTADLRNTTVWRYPLPKLNSVDRSFDEVFPNLDTLFLQVDTPRIFSFPYPYILTKSINLLNLVFPNTTQLGFIGGNYTSRGRVKRVICYAPKAIYFDAYAFSYLYPEEVWVLTAAASLGNNLFSNSSTKIIWYIGDKIKTFNHPSFAALREVHCGFPVAELINFQEAKLDKPSVLLIINSLQPYNAETMSNIPALTLGIDPTLDGDEEINAALLNAQAAVEDGGKGWNVAVSGFTITAGGGATMGLRKPVYATRKPDAEGVWVDAGGTRWAVRYGNTVLENWVANEQLGYEEFATLENALEQWGLREYQPEEAIDD